MDKVGTLLIAVFASWICTCRTDSFNRTLVILDSKGKVSIATNITKMELEHLAVINPEEMMKMNKTLLEVDNKNISKFNCGIPSISTNLDSIAQFTEWPWHVGIVEAKEDLYLCGGSLISSTRILTAGHCVEPYTQGKQKLRLKIRAGEWDVSTNSEPLPHIEALVHKVHIHPEFNNATLENDIALLDLARPVLPSFRANVLPVCIPKPTNQSTVNSKSSLLKRCVVTGWGRKSESSEHSIVLKEIVVPIWDVEICEEALRKHFGPEYKLPNSTLCAGSEGRDACDGDGGGPLVCFEDGKWLQEGIVSFGIGCGRPNSPGIYTRVSSYLKFIQS